jgi:23S rRNA-/tRNA-specific pseudouridylate synthase
MSDRLRILFSDADVLVVDKPPHLPMRTKKGEATDSLVSRVRAHDRRYSSIVPTSRLGTAASGIVTFARTEAGVERSRQNRELGRYDRELLVLLAGEPSPLLGVWSTPVSVAKDGEQLWYAAETAYETREVLPRGALVSVRPRTAVRQQVRQHARAAGCPVLGDGDGRASRAMLHSYALVLSIAGGQLVRVVAEPPADFREGYVSLGGDPRAPTSLLHARRS